MYRIQRLCMLRDWDEPEWEVLASVKSYHPPHPRVHFANWLTQCVSRAETGMEPKRRHQSTARKLVFHQFSEWSPKIQACLTTVSHANPETSHLFAESSVTCIYSSRHLISLKSNLPPASRNANPFERYCYLLLWSLNLTIHTDEIHKLWPKLK